ncbi:MAG: nuclear transport factor 2 family protein [Hyphomonadaceae bacterium]
MRANNALFIAAASLALATASAPADAQCVPDADRVLEQERGVALVLAEQGFDAYQTLFSPDFELWIDGRSLVRDAYLAGVRSWYLAGNRAVATSIEQSEVTFLGGSHALARYVIREDFNNGERFKGRIVSLVRCEAGVWRLFRSNVFTLSRGRIGD